MLCLNDWPSTTIIPQLTEITQFIFGQPLKPFDVADDTILKRTKFAGKPPVWIPMPPH
jgi:hypothetical protein